MAYLIGSTAFAVIVSRMMGLNDPRSYGSGNPGATNVLRSGNKLAALLTLAGDLLKGCGALWLTRTLGFGDFPQALAVVAVAVFFGHLYPVFLRFQGGKGVATAAGVLIALEPLLGAATLATWLMIAVFFRYSSLASVVSALFAPLFYGVGAGRAWTLHWPILFGLIAISGFIIWRHRANLARLLHGQEARLGNKSA
jgi:glycerol-3-phosphate acyltransferase PlsY